ncbi:hypothetical protein AAY473_028510 [Plecturocebus cupreus]
MALEIVDTEMRFYEVSCSTYELPLDLASPSKGSQGCFADTSWRRLAQNGQRAIQAAGAESEISLSQRQNSEVYNFSLALSTQPPVPPIKISIPSESHCTSKAAEMGSPSCPPYKRERTKQQRQTEALPKQNLISEKTSKKRKRD